MSIRSISAIICVFFCLAISAYGQKNQKRNRGETFYHTLNSNTTGHGNIWLTLSGVGSVWDDKPIRMDSTEIKESRKWFSNARAFPEIRAQAGVGTFATFSLESRLLSWSFLPGWISGDVKLTIPNNKEIRFNGFGMNVRYFYQFSETSPTLGGYYGFMPEGFVSKGSNLDVKFIYEMEFLAKISTLPLRLLFNGGARIPFNRINLFQYLMDLGVVYSGYGYDFFAFYSLEAFNNFSKPLVIDQEPKRFAVFFSENPMYLTLGGDVRYDNGISLSIAIPLLLSQNAESRMRVSDGKLLDNTDVFPIEKDLEVTDPFDPWFVKWKVVGAITFPIRFKMTSTEMTRNFLIMKNRKQQTWMDIDNRIESSKPDKLEKDRDKTDNKKEEQNKDSDW